MKYKTTIYIDSALILLFILAVFTGIKLHVAGHGVNYELRHSWAVWHTIISLIFMLLGIIHVKGHWNWYKGLKRGIKNRSAITLLLSLFFMLVTVTGVVLLTYTDSENSQIGLLHYKLGLMMSILGIWHFIKRFSVFSRGVRQLYR